MKKISKILSPFLIIGLLGACSGDDGANGINGTNGVDGIDGTNGVDGADGESGSSSIISSDWIVSGLDENIADYTDSFLIEAPEITQDIIDTGVVLVYGKVVSFALEGVEVYQLPVEFDLNVNEIWSYNIVVDTPTSFIRINVFTPDGDDIEEPWIYEFRYVIIPETPQAESEAKTSNKYSKMSYEEAKKVFDISN